MTDTPATPATTTPAATPAADGTTPAIPATPKAAGATIEQIMQVVPDADKKHLTDFMNAISPEMAKRQMTSKNQLIAMLATVSVETTSFAPIEELGKGEGKYVQNGISYHGRGYIQLTHKGNYQGAGELLKLDLVGNPNLVLSIPVAVATTLAYYCKEYRGLSHDIRPYAERGDFQNVRSIVNAGSPGKWGICWGRPKFSKIIEAGQRILTAGIDPNAPPFSGEGLGCVDGNVTSMVGSASSQPAALDYALKLLDNNSNKSHIFKAELNVAAYPKLLNLTVNTTFEAIGLGKDLDETYKVEELEWVLEDTLILYITATKRDPTMPAANVFAVNPGATGSALSTTPLPPGSGDIPARIMAAGQAYRGTSTKSGPGGGRVACAWAMSYVFQKAGLRTIGVEDNSIVVAVAAIEAGMNKGRGQLVQRAEAIPGDVWIMPTKHIGFCTTAGCTKVLSNSSSKARFTWEDDIDRVNSYYGGQKENLYRVLN